jgi:hypothetical protein
MDDAMALLHKMPQPNARTFHTLLRGAVRDANGLMAQQMYTFLIILKKK